MLAYGISRHVIMAVHLCSGDQKWNASSRLLLVEHTSSSSRQLIVWHVPETKNRVWGRNPQVPDGPCFTGPTACYTYKRLLGCCACTAARHHIKFAGSKLLSGPSRLQINDVHLSLGTRCSRSYNGLHAKGIDALRRAYLLTSEVTDLMPGYFSYTADDNGENQHSCPRLLVLQSLTCHRHGL